MMRCISFFIAVLMVISIGCRHQGVVYRNAQSGVYHTVERHQTLWRICKTYKVDMDETARINGIKDKGRIEVGRRILIPGAKKVLKVDVYIEDVTARERGAAVQYEKGKFIWPLEGKITAKFGRDKRRNHDGIDISSPSGTLIKAADSGNVVYCDNKMRGYGNLIIIEHKDNFFTIYAHNQANLVAEGREVEQGEVIAEVGSTGNATGPHLHFEIRKGSKPLDPLQFLP